MSCSLLYGPINEGKDITDQSSRNELMSRDYLFLMTVCNVFSLFSFDRRCDLMKSTFDLLLCLGALSVTTFGRGRCG